MKRNPTYTFTVRFLFCPPNVAWKTTHTFTQKIMSIVHSFVKDQMYYPKEKLQIQMILKNLFIYLLSLDNAMLFLKELKQIIAAKENWPVAKSLSMNMSHQP